MSTTTGQFGNGAPAPDHGGPGHLGSHPPTEQYLAAMYVLQGQDDHVIQARLAERVGHTAPTVSEMVHRLKEAGYVTAGGRGLVLTASGRQLAEKVLRKHCLAARLLSDVIGLPWHLVHAEADRWEHVISDEVEARLVEVLGHPGTCPHGCPIPGLSTQAVATTVLADAEVGQRVRLVQLVDPGGFEMGALAYMEQNNFLPGCEATVAAEGPDGSLVLDVGDRTLVMGAPMAKRLLVVRTH